MQLILVMYLSGSCIAWTLAPLLLVPVLNHVLKMSVHLWPSPLPIPLHCRFFLFLLAGNKRCNLQQNDITGLCGPSVPCPSVATPTPTPTFRVTCWTISHPTGQPFFLWEHDFITEMNCLIVKTQLPPLAGDGGALRGHFTHCLKSISRNASLDDCPLLSADGPLTATPSTNCAEHLCTSCPKCNEQYSHYKKSRPLKKNLNNITKYFKRI